jgi:hypothetical protein
MSLLAGVVDTGDKPLLSNISANFSYIFEMAPMGYLGKGGNSFMKKPEFENLVSDSLEGEINVSSSHQLGPSIYMDFAWR